MSFMKMTRGMFRMAALSASGIFAVNQIQAQCIGGVTNRGVILPNSAWQQTITVTSGDYFKFPAVADMQYSFTTCGGTTPGAANFDTYLTILSKSGAVSYAFNDNQCALRSYIEHWKAPATDTFRIYITRNACATPGAPDTARIAYRQYPAPSVTGTTCANPYVISTIPFSITGQWTCNMGNEILPATTPVCGSASSNWRGGQDFVFTYTPPFTQCVNITLCNTYAYPGLFIYAGCPGVGGTTCVNYVEATASPTCSTPTLSAVSLTGGVTYYFVVDKNPTTFTVPCIPFDFTINPCPITSGGNNCTDAIVIPGLPYIIPGLSTQGKGNDYVSPADECASSTYLAREDFVFSYVVTTPPVCLDIWIDNTDLYTGVQVTRKCPSAGPAACVQFRGEVNGDPRLRNVTLTAADTYYIVIDRSASASLTYTPFDIRVDTCGTWCTYNPPANNSCSSATLLTAPLDSFCGTTFPAPTYTVDASCCGPTSLTSVWCGSIENNAWFRFVAEATSMTFDIDVSNCTYTDGIQAGVLETSDCVNFTVKGSCWNPGSDIDGSITATGLTIGATYYFMVDGFATDDCDFVITYMASGVVPVEWHSFEGRPEGPHIRLKWATATETDNQRFEIQRGIPMVNGKEKNAYDWQMVGSVTGAGNSGTVQRYSFLDVLANYSPEPYYYRIRQIDIDGKSTFSDIIAVKPDVPEEHRFMKLHPNPASGEVNVELIVSEETDVQLDLVDITGKVVKTETRHAGTAGLFSSKIDVSFLEAGVYFCRIRVASTVFNQKLTVLKE